MTMLGKVAGLPANLLLNTGPMPDGSIHPEDVTSLTEVGRRLRTQGWPAPIAPTPEAPKQKKKKSGNATP
jgi:alpha-L-fucosidase